jgi:hypothetical protein
MRRIVDLHTWIARLNTDISRTDSIYPKEFKFNGIFCFATCYLENYELLV